MPNPTSKLNLVINGVTTQLDIHDANAVDLTNNQTVAGDKEFTGTTTAHDLVPSATDTYNFGSPTAQWNNAYIKLLAINSVSARREIYASSEGVIGQYGAGTVPESAINPFRFYIGKARNYANAPIVIDTSMSPTGSTSITLRAASNESGNALDHRVNIGTSATDNSDGTKTRNAYVQFYNTNELRPNKNNYCDLGTSSYKWKNVNTNAINGINPGALSLPSISSSGANAWIALDTTDWVKNDATSAAQKYTPPADGWLNIRVNNATMLGLAITGGGNYMHQMVRSETPNGLALLIPVFKNTEVAILVAGNENLVYDRSTFYPCQGNV